MAPGVAFYCMESPHGVSLRNTQLPLPKRVTLVIPETRCSSEEKNINTCAHTTVVLDVYYAYEVAFFFNLVFV